MSSEQADVKAADDTDIDIQDAEAQSAQLGTVKSFIVKWTDRETGKVHVGTFTVRRPSLGQLGQMAVLKAKMNGGEKVDPQTDFLHEMIAGLQVMITDSPPWWNPETFFDASPLRKVWDHVRSWLETFRKRVG